MADRKIFYQIIKINKTQILLKVFFWFHEVLNFLKNDGKMFKYSKRLYDVLIFEKNLCRKKRWYGNIFESGVKHLTSNGQMMDQTFVYVVHSIKHLWVIM
jgi:hypothetical protein